MRKSIFVPVLIATAFLLTASATFGSEADELREKAKMAKQEAVELKNLGRMEESEKLARKAKELLEAADRLEGKKGPGPDPEMMASSKRRAAGSNTFGLLPRTFMRPGPLIWPSRSWKRLRPWSGRLVRPRCE